LEGKYFNGYFVFLFFIPYYLNLYELKAIFSHNTMLKYILNALQTEFETFIGVSVLFS